VVRFQKDDFIGRGGLVAARDQPQRSKLVGFVMKNGAVPHDGDAVVSGFVPVGRVTSSRLSPTMGKGFGFAWVPMELAEEGKIIHIRVDGRTYPAGVTMEPFYDPEGRRLRE
jgi:glycine cleavage system aminomethyltransferase T